MNPIVSFLEAGCKLLVVSYPFFLCTTVTVTICTSAMSKSSKLILPGTFELWCLTVASLAILLVGNMRFLLARYGLVESSELINTQINARLKTGLHLLDSFSATATAITFVLWVLAGIITISLVNTFAHASEVLRFEQDVSSNKFIHPRNFDPRRYWRHIFVGTVWSFILFCMLALGVVLYMAIVIPVSFSFIQRFLLSLHLGDIPYMLLGLGAVFGGTVVIYMLIKSIVLQHRVA
jgi:hypothetical protein